MTTILVVDDDKKLVDMLRRTLSYEGYKVLTAADGADALTQARTEKPDAVVLDWMMPGLDGIEVAKRIRSADATPILMLTARDSVENRVEGLDSGADDYLVKPFAPEELLARIRALLRRTETLGDERPLTFSDLLVDPVTREVKRGERSIELTPREFGLLTYLMRNPRRVLTRDRIVQDVWGYDYDGYDNVLEVYIGYLRSKTEAGSEPRLIHTVRGIGYVMRTE
jgi:two-component system response regulator MprA